MRLAWCCSMVDARCRRNESINSGATIATAREVDPLINRSQVLPDAGGRLDSGVTRKLTNSPGARYQGGPGERYADGKIQQRWDRV